MEMGSNAERHPATMADCNNQAEFILGVDLVQHTIDYIGFLNQAKPIFNKLAGDPRCLRKALWRYESLWIPLVGKYSETAFHHAPPLDIHLLLHIHILYGKQMFTFYQHGHLHWLTTLRPLTVLVKGDSEEDIIETAWKDSYPREPYKRSYDEHVEELHIPESNLEHPFTSIIDYLRLVMDVVGLPHFRDNAFVVDAVDRYKRYMYTLRKCAPAEREYHTMPLDVKFVWFAHSMLLESYDTSVKSILYNPPSLLDAMASKHFELSSSKVVVMWNKTYSEEYLTPGAKLNKKHDPTKLVRFVQIPSELMRPIQDEFCDISVNNVKVSDIWTRDKRITVEMRRLAETSFTYVSMFKVSTKTGQNIELKQVNDIGRVKFDLRNHRGFEIIVHGKAGGCCMSADEHISTIFWDPRKAFEGRPVHDGDVNIVMPRIYKSDPKVCFGAKFQVHKAEVPIHLGLLREPFGPGELDPDLALLVDRLSLWSDTDLDGEEAFSTAKHSIHMRPGQLGLSCEIFIHNNTDLAAVSIKQNGSDYLVTSAYIVGEDILPSYQQITNECPISLDLTEGELAMVIRNAGGIWGLCTIKQDLTKGMGRASVMFYHVAEGLPYHVSVHFQEQAMFTLAKVTVDLQTGRFTLAPNCPEVAEYCTLGLCVGILYVLLHGRKPLPAVSQKDLNRDVTDSQTRSLKSHYERTRSAKHKLSFGQNSPSPGRAMTLGKLKMNRKKKKSIVCTMLLACGLQHSSHMGSQRSSVYSLSSLATSEGNDGQNNGDTRSKTEDRTYLYRKSNPSDEYTLPRFISNHRTKSNPLVSPKDSHRLIDHSNSREDESNSGEVNDAREDSAIGTENEDEIFIEDDSIIFIEHL